MEYKVKYIFIINPEAGLEDKTEEIRNYIAAHDEIEGVVFNTEESGHETSVMKEMLEIFDDENVRVCVCGGSGTLSKTLDAINVEDMGHVDVAFYPCGLTNDFIKNFKEDGRKEFENLNAVLSGRTEHVDYLRCNIDGNNNVQNELLFVTMGISANIEMTSRSLRFIAGLSPAIMYGLATLFTLPFSKAIDYEVIIDGVDYSREYKLIYVGNGVCMGGSFIPIKKDNGCRDGYFDVLLLKRLPAFKSIRYLTEFMHGEIADKRPEDVSVIRGKEITVRRKDGRAMRVNSDGELHSGYSWNIRVVNNRLKFVVPDGAEFISSAEELVKCMGLC